MYAYKNCTSFIYTKTYLKILVYDKSWTTLNNECLLQ